MNGPNPRSGNRLTNLALAGVAAIGLYLTAASLYEGPRISTSAWLAIGRRPLDAPATRWVSVSAYVPHTHEELPNAAPWRKTVADLTVRGSEGIGGCWRVRLLLDMARRQREHYWLLPGPDCEPDPGAPPTIKLPPGLTQE